MATHLPRIAVIGTGGTISSLGASSLDVLDYPDFGQKLTAEALLDRFPETRLVADPLPMTLTNCHLEGASAIGLWGRLGIDVRFRRDIGQQMFTANLSAF